MAQEMGARLGQGDLLFGQVQVGESLARLWAMTSSTIEDNRVRKERRMATAYDPTSVPAALIHKIGALPRERIAEVEDFVDFIAMKDG
jgi:hypothetical protein